MGGGRSANFVLLFGANRCGHRQRGGAHTRSIWSGCRAAGRSRGNFVRPGEANTIIVRLAKPR